MAEDGRATFEQSCAQCHGVKATGGTGPNLLGSSLVRQDQDGNLIGGVIQEGRPDKGMPAFPSLTSIQIGEIAAFLHARIALANTQPSGEDPEGYPLKQLLTGNAEAGREYFDGRGGCATCHSPTGDLAGIASKYSPVELTAVFLHPAHDAVTATVTLRSGRKVTGRLLHDDGFYVAIVDEEGWYRSWPLDEVKVQTKDPLARHLDLLRNYTDKDIHDVFSYLETLK